MGPITNSPVAFVCAVATGVPFAGALWAAGARINLTHRRALPAVAIVASAISSGLIGWLWWTEAELTWRTDWLAAANIGFGWYLDGLSLLFALMAVAFGLLTVVYSSVYLPRMASAQEHHWPPSAYYAALLFFTGSMLGLVLSEDLFQFYVFWELTDIASFVLIGLDRRNGDARRAAVMALTFTALGGLALLVGFVMMASLAGTSSIPAILDGGWAEVPSHHAELVAVLILLAAATKSAQFPFYVWLPNAMVAPTPANAFLDSAALVAAGLFLVVRFNPLFGALTWWTTALIGMGTASMLVGGVLALRQRNLKWLLAYSTLSLFGFMFVLAGLEQIFAALWFLVQHAIVKAGLFFVAGIVEQRQTLPEEQPGGANRWIIIAVSGILALSLVGVPPLAGFWMKETFFVRLLGDPARPLLAAVGVVAASLTLVYMLRFLRLAFFDADGDKGSANAPLPMLAVVVLLAAATVVIGIFPQPASENLVEPAAVAVTNQSPEVEFAYHLNLALLLSASALVMGALLHWTQDHWQPWLGRMLQSLGSLDAYYRRTAAGIVDLGKWVQSVQNGSLQRYLFVVLVGFIALLMLPLPMLRQQPWIEPSESGPLLAQGLGVNWAGGLILLLIALGTVLTFATPTHLRMLLALGMVGFMLAALFGLFAAPSLGLVQVHVETLATVLFILILVRVPHRILKQFEARSFGMKWSWPQLLVAAVLGLASAGLSWLAIVHQPSDPVALWYGEQTMQLTGAEDVVAAILVHFRALDTLGEIVVFSITTLGVLVLVRRMREEAE